jgi:DNA mismatch endonuclease (patch repair protein)
MMVDRYPPDVRSRVMRAVKGKNTSPELLLRKVLTSHGIRGYRLHRKDIAGKPDIAFIGRKVAVFVDGAWWHGHPDKWWIGRSGAYWDTKIGGNIARDRRVDATLAEQGWTVVRLWDFEVLESPDVAAEKVARAIGLERYNESIE